MMDKAWLIALLPFFMLGINMIFQLLIVHLTRRIGFSMVAGFIMGLLSNIVIFFIISIDFENVCIALISYLALSFGYWAFLNLNITALRIRLLRELLKVNQTGLTNAALFERYSSKELLNRRLDRLKQWNHIIKINGHWMLQSNKLLFFLYVMIFLRQIIFGKERAHKLLRLKA